MIPYVIASPSPVPFPGPFVEKNGSKIFSRVFLSMPVPVSDTSIRAYIPLFPNPCARKKSSPISNFPVEMASAPPSGMASLALVARFISTCSIWPASAVTMGGVSLNRVVKSISSPISRFRISSTFRTRRFRSTGTGLMTCFLPKARRLFVNWAARSDDERMASIEGRSGSPGAIFIFTMFP